MSSTKTGNPGNRERIAEVLPAVSEPKIVRCAACGEEASTARRFCSKCGGQLWDPCLACQDKNPVDVLFCGSCGADVAAEVAKSRQSMEDALQQAEEFAEAGRLQNAVSVLQPLSQVDHSQLDALAKGMASRIQQYEATRENMISNSATIVAECEQLLQQRRFHAARQRLASIPPALQNRQVRDLVEQVQAYVDESSLLRGEVKGLLHTKDYEQAVPKVARLVELNPEDEQLEQLHQQLQQRQQQLYLQQATKLCAAAKDAILKYKYQHALAAVEQVPPSVEDPRILQFIAGVKERAWLCEQLRSAPHVTPTLLAIAARFQKLQPNDQRHADLAKQLQMRWAKENAAHPGQPVPWARPPAESRLGVPVTLFPPLDSLRGKLSKSCSPQSMLVPFGLALQSVGRGAISIDLTPKEKNSAWRDRLRIKGSKKPSKIGWGIEVSTKNLKAIQVSVEGDCDDIKVLQSITIPHPTSMTSEQAGDKELLAGSSTESIEKFLQENDLRGQSATINLPGAKTLARFFDLPGAMPDKFKSAVEYEVRSRIPLKEEETLYDYHSFDLPVDSEQEMARRHVMLVAASRRHVEATLGPFQDAGIVNLTLQSDCVALHNAIATGPSELRTTSESRSICVVEIGASGSNFLVLSPSGVWFRGLYAGMSQFDKALALKLKKTRDDAEALRRAPEKATRMHEIHEILLPEMRSFTEAIHRTLTQVEHETGIAVSQIYVCGGGSEQFGLLQHLQSPNESGQN